MTKLSAVVDPSRRSEARSAIWRYLGSGGDAAPRATAGAANDAANAAAAAVAGSDVDCSGDIAQFSSGLARRVLKRGISSRAIAPLCDFLGLGRASVAEFLDIDRSTANRRAAKDQPLPTHAAEGVLRLLELDQLATDTFETEDEAARWLRTPHPMLDGDAPWEAAKTAYGAQQVKDMLVAIKYGGVV